MKRFTLIIICILLVTSLFAQRFETEQEAFEHRVRYKLIHDGGDWKFGEYVPWETMPESAPYGMRQSFFYKWNKYRKENGLPEVHNLKILDKTARISAQMCATRERLDHDYFDGWDIVRYMLVFIREGTAFVSENLAFFPLYENKYQAEILLKMWINSPPHNEALLMEGLEYGGLGGYQYNGNQYYALHMITERLHPDAFSYGAYEVMGLPLK